MTINKFLAGTIFGLTAGAAIGYLLTTYQGKEILSELRDLLSKAGIDVKGTTRKMKSDLKTVAEKGKKWEDILGK